MRISNAGDLSKRLKAEVRRPRKSITSHRFVPELAAANPKVADFRDQLGQLTVIEAMEKPSLSTRTPSSLKPDRWESGTGAAMPNAAQQLWERPLTDLSKAHRAESAGIPHQISCAMRGTGGWHL